MPADKMGNLFALYVQMCIMWALWNCFTVLLKHMEGFLSIDDAQDICWLEINFPKKEEGRPKPPPPTIFFVVSGHHKFY